MRCVGMWVVALALSGGGPAVGLERLSAADMAGTTGGYCRLKLQPSHFERRCPEEEPCWDAEWDDCQVVYVTKVTEKGTQNEVLPWHVGMGGDCEVLEQDPAGDCEMSQDSRRIQLTDGDVEWGEGCVDGGTFDACTDDTYVVCAIANTYALGDTNCQVPTGTITLRICGCAPYCTPWPEGFAALRPSS